MSRRAFLEVTAGGAAAAVLGCADDGAGAGGDAPPDPLRPHVPDDPDSFTFGVQASDADATSVRLTVRGEPGLEVLGPDDQLITLGESGFGHLDLQGLAPGTEHRYRLFVRDEAGEPAGGSATGRFNSLPADDDPRPLTFGASACTHRRWSPWPSLSHIAERGLDFHLLLGDTVYADSATDLAGYRAEWAFSYASDDYQALRASTGIYATWDDHEVGNNWVRHPDDDAPSGGGRNRQTLVGPTRFSAALQAFKEHAGLRGDRIWRSFRWGSTAEFFILDCRGERTPPGEDDADPAGSYLGREQMDWLKAGLSASTAHWKFVVNSVPILSIPEINSVLGDGWLGYPTDRAEILDHIEGKIPGVVWVSGDYHTFVVGRVEPDPGTPWHNQWDVLVGHGGSIENPVVEAIAGNQDDDVRFLAADMRPGACVLTASPPGGDDTLAITYVGDEGEALHEVLLQYTSV